MPKEQSAGGILIAKSNNNREQTGVIISMGPGKIGPDGLPVPIDLKRGDHVIITGYAGLEIRDQSMSCTAEGEYIIIREEDVLFVMDD